MYRCTLFSAATMFVGCTTADPNFELFSCTDAVTANCVQIPAETGQDLLVTVNSMMDDTTVVLGKGTFNFDNQVTIRGVSGITLTGQGMDATFLDFADQETQTNGVDVVSDNFTIQDLTVQNAKKDGIRVEDSDGVIFRRIRTT